MRLNANLQNSCYRLLHLQLKLKALPAANHLGTGSPESSGAVTSTLRKYIPTASRNPHGKARLKARDNSRHVLSVSHGRLTAGSEAVSASEQRTTACRCRLSAGGRDRCADENPTAAALSGLLSYLRKTKRD